MLVKTWDKEGIDYLSFIYVHCCKICFSEGPLLSLFSLLIQKQQVKLLSMFLTSLNSSWALTFLTTLFFPKGCWAMFLDYFFVIGPFFPILCKAFLHWSSVISSRFSQAGLLIFLHIFLSIVMHSSCACNVLSLITCQLSWAPLPFRTFLHGIPCTSSLNKLKSSLLKSQSILCYLLSLLP